MDKGGFIAGQSGQSGDRELEYAIMGTTAELATLRTRLEALEKWGRMLASYLDWIIYHYPLEKPRAEAMKTDARTLGLVEDKGGEG